MPLHTLPEGAQLIEALTDLGTALGYVAERERPVERNRGNPPAVDVAWLSEKDQAYPLMIFEVESRASASAANNPMKVFGQPTERFEKPLFFFHIFIEAGPETSRIDNLRTVFGTHNYRTYRSDEGGLDALLKDVLSQHRRLHRNLQIEPLLNALLAATWRSISMPVLLQHIEELAFTADYLRQYAVRSTSHDVFRHEYLRLLRKIRTPAWRGLDVDYGTWMDDWVQPMHIGLQALDAPEAESWLVQLADWQERSGPYTQIGPHLGLSREYDDFVLGRAPVLLALIAALMHKVPRAGEYIFDQLWIIVDRVRSAGAEVSFFPAIWALHLAAALGDETRFERVRRFLNDRGGVPPEVLYEPPDAISVVYPDERWSGALSDSPTVVPDMAGFRRALAPHYSRTANTDRDLWDLAVGVLTDIEGTLEWSAPTALLLHAPSGVTYRAAS